MKNKLKELDSMRDEFISKLMLGDYTTIQALDSNLNFKKGHTRIHIYEDNTGKEYHFQQEDDGITMLYIK